VWAALAVSGPLFVIPATPEPRDWVWPIGLIAFAPSAALLLTFRPGNRVGRVLGAVGVAVGVLFAAEIAAVTWQEHAATVYLELLVSLAVGVTFWGVLALLFLFPTGQIRPGWPRWSFWLYSFGLLFLFPALSVVRPGPTDSTGRPNPLAVEAAWVEPLIEVSLSSLVVGAVFGIAALIQRFRQSKGVERAQLKLFLAGAAMVLGLVTLISFVPESDDDGVVGAAMSALVVLGFWALPGAIVAAILRYRLYDIDRIASRTVTYLVTVALLGLGYAGSLVTLQNLLPLEGPLPVAASTLAMAAVSSPLVQFVKGIVDRRFFRSRYDAREVVSRFSTMARADHDLDELTRHLTEVVRTTFEPNHLAIWIAGFDNRRDQVAPTSARLSLRA
jgi:hypothetical protein